MQPTKTYLYRQNSMTPRRRPIEVRRAHRATFVRLSVGTSSEYTSTSVDKASRGYSRIYRLELVQVVDWHTRQVRHKHLSKLIFAYRKLWRL
jgi:hypothetical protein